MDERNFLAHVLPDTGPYCVVQGTWVADPKDPKKVSLAPYAMVADDLDEAAAIARGIDAKHKEAYFCVGALIDRTLVPTKRTGKLMANRAITNIRELRCYFLDLDVKPGKYASQLNAIQAVRSFCKAIDLPRPTIVSSGGGIHVYWTLTETVPRDMWLVNAAKLKQLAVHHQLHCDATLITNAACILRVAGTHNWKNANQPRRVEVL